MLYRRILITGANGLLGQALVRWLSRFPEYDVLATGRDDAPRYSCGSGGYAPLDITDYDAVSRLFQDFTPDVVINAAALSQVDVCEADKDACCLVNVEAVDHLPRRCLAAGSRLIQVSTDFVFDGAGGPYTEKARPKPINFYGKSKWAAENAVRGAGLDQWAIARTVLVFGTGEALSRSNIVMWVVNNLMAGQPIRVVQDQFRTPTYVADLAIGLERLVRYNKTGTFHLSGREYLSVYDFARLVADVYDLDASLISPTHAGAFKEAAPRPLKTGFIILKAETELGYRPRPLREALLHLGIQLGLPVSTP